MLRLTQDPASRLRITNSRENAMIQLQNGRLHYNWIGRPREEYPRYTGVRPEFDRVHAELCAFLTEESLESLRANQWEVTYVNHIPRGSVWNDPGDWAKLFSGLLGRSAPHEARLESLSGAWHFEIPDKVGRLHIDLKHARLADGPEVLRLTLTARGPVDDRTSLSDGLDRGRKAIVCTFRDITSRDAQRYWGLES
jgi:uncharacterized protein (TIGR04255 family)